MATQVASWASKGQLMLEKSHCLATGRLILDLEGLQLTAAEADLIKRPAVSGVILFARNIYDLAQVQELAAQLKALRPDLLLAVDQEGGRVQRLRQGFTLLPAMRTLGQLFKLDKSAGMQAAKLLGSLMAAEVIHAGLDLSFAPVLDLDYGYSAVIGDRAFAAEPEQVTLLAGAFSAGMRQVGMAATGKHFPGHGYVAADSHTDLPLDTRPLASIQASCLQPFRALAQALQGIMPAHVVYSALDQQPAGFSKPWLQILRQELGFTGVIFSDDLNMQAAVQAGSPAQRAAKALAAGCDQLLVCNNPAAAEEVLLWLESSNFTPCTRLPSLLAQPQLAVTWLTTQAATTAKLLAQQLQNSDLVAAVNLLQNQ